MTKSIPDIKVNLKQIYKTYSDQITFSNSVSSLLIEHSNISASGAELESALRKSLMSLLPERVGIGHGHVVDEHLKISYQQDVIIYDNLYSKSLIHTLDGTEFFPYESIFATGEVKRSWSRKNLTSHIKSITRTKSALKREKVDSSLIESGASFIKTSKPITQNPFRNPLFSFSFSVEFDPKINLSGIGKILKETSPEYLPNISIVLNEGIFVYVNSQKLEIGQLEIILYPEFKIGDQYCWVFISLDPEDCLAYLVFMLSQHLNETVLSKTSYLKYIQNMVEFNMVNVKFI